MLTEHYFIIDIVEPLLKQTGLFSKETVWF